MEKTRVVNSTKLKIDSTQKEALELLQQFVEIDTSVGNKTNLKKIYELMTSVLAKHITHIEYLENDRSEQLLRLKCCQSPNPVKKVALVLHVDTIEPPSEKWNFNIDEANSLITGPGVCDMKGGITVCLSGLNQFLNETAVSNLDIEIYVSPTEETGSIGFHHFFRNFGNEADYVFCFEPGCEQANLIWGRNGNLWYEISIEAEEFHTGRHAKDKPNASLKLVELLNQLKEKASSLDLGFNVTSLLSNTHFSNQSPRLASAKFDLRFFENSLKKEFVDYFDQLIHAMRSEVLVRTEILDDCPAFFNAKNSASRGEEVLKIYKRFGSELADFSFCAGASDINHFSNGENVCIDGLGPCGGGMHSQAEHIHIQSFFDRIKCFKELLKLINQNNH